MLKPVNEPFGKFYAKAFTGSMMGAGANVFAVMAYVIANCRPPDGIVELNPNLLSAVIGTPVDEIVKAIDYLCSADPQSRTPTAEGRRLLKCGQFAYRLVNWGIYRDGTDYEARREYFRNKMAESRAKKGLLNKQLKPLKKVTHTEAEAEAEADKTKAPPASSSKNTELKEQSEAVLAYLSEKTGRSMRMTPSRLSSLVARLCEVDGDVAGVRKMIDRQCALWKGTDMEQYLRPDTLFRASKFMSYYETRDLPAIQRQPPTPLPVQSMTQEEMDREILRTAQQ